MRVSLILGCALALNGCGPALDEKPKAPDPCKQGQAELERRLGPEFDRVVTGRRLPLPAPATGGCALVYLQVDEEFAGEVAGDSASGAAVDQQLAVVLPDGRGKPTLTLMGGSPMAPGAVLLTLGGRDVDGDGQPELVVEESGGPAADYNGLRLFAYQAGSPTASEIFADSLRVKTPEGIDIAATWGTGSHKGANAIILDGAGTKKIYTWNRAAKKFTYSEAATLEARPKPAVPEAPVAEGEEAKKAPEGEKPGAPTGLPSLDL